MDIIKQDKFEELFIANWAKILDSGQIMAFVLKTVRDHAHTFSQNEMTVRPKGTQVSLSRCQIVPKGFILWAEFSVPLDNKTSVGTTELFLANTGELTHIQTLGSTYYIGK